jgi:uncharacterized protein
MLAIVACSPRPDGPMEFVTDQAGVLEDGAVRNITERIEEYERETCHRLHVLVIPSLAGKDFAAFTAAAMEERQVAPPPLESGLLLTVAIAEGKARIDAGRGLQTLVNSGRADDILKTGAFPFFSEGRYGEGIVSALVLLMDEGRRIAYPDELRPEYCR